MKAAICQSYGPPEVVKVEDIPRPSVGEDEEGRVLIQVYSASVNPYDYLFRKGYWPTRLSNGLFKPKQQQLGIDVAGVVVAVGQNVDRFQVGDRVFGNCLGSHAEYVRARQNYLSKMPANVTFRVAAAVPTAALTALQALRDVAQIKKGQSVLVYGASGGVGHFAVQLARFYGAEVSAVCSTSNLPWVKELGAHQVIDYTREDFTRNGRQYDIILDAVARRTYFSCKASLTETGLYVTENPLKPAFQLMQLLFSQVRGDKRVRTHLAQANIEDMDLLRDLLEAGEIKPVIERTYPLEEIAAAHRHVENGHTRGKVVIEVLEG